ncbi:pyridoxamine 5'-phosphate oxidase family protein [Actinocorallia sp. A-T 12471]|uniref:pyridoxamine 5'-phosphate oxidase family protein n=1 Tax=Actinocorallia sp. A-T 12471 TaxID=3089813 RepID=UPI0029CB1232|nr:pyridoxamine 5'-phosphate oxidase family protein [Actinocorallia sp. A-T 12471]MDX6744332.1 pyridoxamine 5'-phosphate oxidase family protein [Actinocorallia sp. A-T 12471]
MTGERRAAETLTEDQCLDLLVTVPVGRVAFTDRALPAIQPVNFVMDGTDVVLRTGRGSKLAIAMRRAVVAFEAGAFDPVTHAGWTVTVLGEARTVTDPAELARLAALPLRVWAGGSRDHYIRISGRYISGRRLWEAAA